MSVIVITGASAGVGLAVAERFAKAGWQVVLVAREAERLASAVDLLKGADGCAMGFWRATYPTLSSSRVWAAKSAKRSAVSTSG